MNSTLVKLQSGIRKKGGKGVNCVLPKSEGRKLKWSKNALFTIVTIINPRFLLTPGRTC